MLAQLAPAVWAGGSVLADPAGKKNNPTSSILLFVVFVVVIGFLIVNARRRSKVMRGQQEQIAIGSTIVTRSGMIATLIDRTDDFVVLQLEDGTRARFIPQAVGRVWYEPEPDNEERQHAAGEPPADGEPLAD